MKRREFLRHSATAVTGLTLGASWLGQISCNSRKVHRPNILIILADDAGWNDVGYHNPEMQTPHIDRLARQGVELHRFYASPLCSPTRAALLTGRHPSRFGILGPIIGGAKETLPKEVVTLAAFLQRQGYTTAISGKWHLGLKPEDGPKQFGFDHSYGYFHGQIDPYTHLYKWGDKTWHRDDQYLEEEGHATDLITDEAVRFIERHRQEANPFFLYVAYSVPHFPIEEEAKWIEAYPATMHPDRRKFAASMTHMDAGIGRILAAIEEKNMAENTLILFMSDNGAQEKFRSGPDYYNGKFPPAEILGDNRPLRGWKGSLYEGGIRVPACLRWPGRLKPRRIDEVIAVEDIYPTIVSLLGCKIHAMFDGMDIWPTLCGRALPDRALYWRTADQVAVRKGAWKLIRTFHQEQVFTEELFDLERDENETTDCLEEHGQIASMLRVILQQKMTADEK